jgi:hypothetical protein
MVLIASNLVFLASSLIRGDPLAVHDSRTATEARCAKMLAASRAAQGWREQALAFSILSTMTFFTSSMSALTRAILSSSRLWL